MGKVYYNKREIPIPDGMHINHSDGRVYTITRDLEGKKKRVVFGKATSESTMRVNDTFKMLYPDLWREYYGDEDLHPFNLRCGTYALTLGAGHRSGLYKILIDSFGPQHANAIMDFSMYSFLARTDVAQLYEDTMAGQALFAGRLYSDSWYSSLFNSGITGDEIHKFKIEWIRRCKELGISSVWVAIDGSNNECRVKDGDLCEPGKAKTHKNVTLVSYIYAVNADNGMPVTWFVNDGSMVDSKAFNEICQFMKDYDISIKGVILDRGFASMNVIETVRACGYEYIIMLPGDTYGHVQMMQKHAEDVRWKVKNAISKKGVFGISEEGQLFEHYKYKTNINMFFDGAGGSIRSIDLLCKVISAKETIEKNIEEGLKAAVPPKMKKYLEIAEEDGRRKVICDYDAWQMDMDGKGYFSITDSLGLGAAEAYSIYHKRDASETQYMVMKSMEGFGITRVHSMAGIQSKLAICFAASVLRNQIMNECIDAGLDTNRSFREVNRIKLQLVENVGYHPVENYSMRQKELLSRFDIYPESFDVIAKVFTHRTKSDIHSQEQKMPSDIVGAPTKKGRPKKQDGPAKPKKKRGRPPKKKTDSDKENLKPKRSPGRPPGSLNKKTIERLAREKAEGLEPRPKRGPGRPPGSLNKRTIQRMAQESSEGQKPKRGRGRPPGSLNKKTLERLAREGKKN